MPRADEHAARSSRAVGPADHTRHRPPPAMPFADRLAAWEDRKLDEHLAEREPPPEREDPPRDDRADEREDPAGDFIPERDLPF